MKLGYGLISCQRVAGDDRDWTQLYREALDLTRLSEQVGIDSVWTTEHHFVDDGYMPSLLVTSAAMAAVTERIAIGTGVVLAPLHDPIRLAEDAATVDLISEGRLVLGLGLGWSDIEFTAFGADRSRRGKAMDEILTILRAAWSGEPIDHHGEIYDLPTVGVRPTPDRSIPIWIGGGADAALRRAALLADGFFSNAAASDLTHQIGVVQEERDRLGVERDFQWTHYQYVYVTDDVAAGWDAIMPHIHHSRWKYADMGPSAHRPAGPVAAPPPLNPSEEDRLRSMVVVGPPEAIAEHITATARAAGTPIDVVARAHYPAMSFGEQSEQIHRLAEEVKPLLG